MSANHYAIRLMLYVHTVYACCEDLGKTKLCVCACVHACMCLLMDICSCVVTYVLHHQLGCVCACVRACARGHACMCTFSYDLINFCPWQDERDSLLRIKDTLEQEKEDMMAKQTGLEEDLREKQEDLGKTKVCVCACVHACMCLLMDICSCVVTYVLHHLSRCSIIRVVYYLSILQKYCCNVYYNEVAAGWLPI